MDRLTESDQLRFLDQLQRVLATGRFSASYKFALLRALGALAVERGSDDGSPLRLHARDIADKFIDYYWRQAVPYSRVDGVSDVVLHQTRETGKNAAVLNRIV